MTQIVKFFFDGKLGEQIEAVTHKMKGADYVLFGEGVDSRGVRGIFFRGGKVIFPDFFPSMKCFFQVENFPFW